MADAPKTDPTEDLNPVEDFKPPVNPTDEVFNVPQAVDRATKNAEKAGEHVHSTSHRLAVQQTLDEDGDKLATHLQQILVGSRDDDKKLGEILKHLPQSKEAKQRMAERIKQSQKNGADIASRYLGKGEQQRNDLIAELSAAGTDPITGAQTMEYAPVILNGQKALEFLDPKSSPRPPDELLDKVKKYLIRQLPNDQTVKKAEDLGDEFSKWIHGLYDAGSFDDSKLHPMYNRTNIAQEVAEALQRANLDLTNLQVATYSNLSPAGMKGIMGEGLSEKDRAKVFANPRKIKGIIDGLVFAQTARIEVRISGQDAPQEFYGNGKQLADQLDKACKDSEGNVVGHVIMVRVKRDEDVKKALTESTEGVIFAADGDKLELVATDTAAVSAKRDPSAKDDYKQFSVNVPMATMPFRFTMKNTDKGAFLADTDPAGGIDKPTSSFEDVPEPPKGSPPPVPPIRMP